MQTVLWAISSYDLKESLDDKTECANCHYMFDSNLERCPVCKFYVGGWKCSTCGTFNSTSDTTCTNANCNGQPPTPEICSCGCQHPTGTQCPCCTSRHFRHRRFRDTGNEILLANSVDVDLPPYFAQSKCSRKIIGVQKITVYQKKHGEWQPVNCSVHSDSFVRENAFFDFFVCLANTDMYSSPKEFVIGDSAGEFTFWLRDTAGKIMDVYPTKTKVIMELVLKF